jgi:hypothetical protein
MDAIDATLTAIMANPSGSRDETGIVEEVELPLLLLLSLLMAFLKR